MSANENLSSKQLAFWRTAKEIKEGVTHSYDRGGGALGHLWERKLDESKTGALRNARYTPTRKRKGNTLYESIKSQGVKQPVELGHQLNDPEKRMSITEGHHRVAAAYDINPNMLIPTHEEIEGDESWRGKWGKQFKGIK